MSTSDTEARRKTPAVTGSVYLLLSLACAAFGAVYETFSHGVYSPFMVYAFVFPLAGGALPFLLMALGAWPPARRAACRLYHSGIAALTVGSLVQGALEIYGTTNRLVSVYWIAGIAFVLLGAAVYLSESGAGRRPTGQDTASHGFPPGRS